MIAQGQVDPATLERRHRLQLEHLAGLLDAGRRPVRDVPELALAASAIVLDVDEDAGPLAHPAREHQVHEVLQRREALALAPDERSERLVPVLVADDVEAARVARLNLDPDVEPEVSHQLLEDLLAGGERLGRRLGGLELGALGGDRAARRRHEGRFVWAERRRRPLVAARAAILPARRAAALVAMLVTALRRPRARRGAGRS